MPNTIKAERATIQFGEIQINVYMLPDSSYRFSGRNITDAVKEHHSSLAREMGVKSLESLPGADLERRKISAGKEGSPFISVSLDDAVDYWTLRALAGNPYAVGILSACTKESLERRADNAFKVKRSEEERDQRLALRMKRIAARLAWTDIIKEDQQARGVYLTEQGRKEFALLTYKVNMALFKVPNFQYNRDNMTIEQQLEIETFEYALRRRYRPETDLEQAVDMCLSFLNAA